MLELASELHETSKWLPAATDDLLLCIREHKIYEMLDKRWLLDTLGQLLEQVLFELSLL